MLSSRLLIGIAATIVATLSQMTAFQRHRAVEVVPVTFAVPVFLPVLLGLAVLREHWRTAPLGGLAFALGAVLLLVGSSRIARAQPVLSIARPDLHGSP